ncbi:hypothetical protein H8356DRAFT_1338539 [Neocallimastix lanati (nom. inval.)]|nr:hypothetical protein H8356DRAFT_1338539 [Neocallimastix sp. JGI-2020a]
MKVMLLWMKNIKLKIYANCKINYTNNYQVNAINHKDSSSNKNNSRKIIKKNEFSNTTEKYATKKQNEIKIGELVKVKKFSRYKLDPYFVGPYQVVKKKFNTIQLMVPNTHTCLERPVHLKNIIKFNTTKYIELLSLETTPEANPETKLSKFSDLLIINNSKSKNLWKTNQKIPFLIIFVPITNSAKVKKNQSKNHSFKTNIISNKYDHNYNNKNIIIKDNNQNNINENCNNTTDNNTINNINNNTFNKELLISNDYNFNNNSTNINNDIKNTK